MRPQFEIAAFTAGEMDSPFFARTDLGKYDLGLALCKNFVIDYKGGVKTRGGMTFVNYARSKAALFEFRLGAGLSSVLIVMTEGKAHFLYEGAYMLRTGTSVVAAAGNVLTAPGHDLLVGDLAYFSGAALPDDTYLVTAVNGNQVTLTFPNGVVPPHEGNTGTISKARTTPVPYTEDELDDLQMSQDYLTATFTHPAHGQRTLTFDPETEIWSFEYLQIGTNIFPPDGLDVTDYTPDNTSPSSAVFAVSSVDANGVESVIGPPIIVRGLLNYLTEAGDVSLIWRARPGASFYRVYRSIVTSSPDMNIWSQLGLIGETSATTLVDNGITPDYTISPQQNNNPFANGALLDLTVEAWGSGYDEGTTLVVRDPTGTGFIGQAVVTAGVVTSCVVEEGGEGYTDPVAYLYASEGRGFIGTVVLTDGVITGISVLAGGEQYPEGDTRITTGANATFIGLPVLKGGQLRDIQILSSGCGYDEDTVIEVSSTSGTDAVVSIHTLSPLSGNNPRTSIRYQQRQVFAGTENLPNAIFGSKPKAPNDFNVSMTPNDGDSYLHLTDAESLIPIRHLLKHSDSLLIFHDDGVDRLSGDDKPAVTALSKSIERQVTMPVSDVRPLMIENTVIFTSADGATVQAVEPSPYNDTLTATNLSVLAPHLFGEGKRPVSMAWSGVVDRLLWVVREDGRLLSLTFVRDQEVFAWARHETRGFARRVCSVREGEGTSIYLYVERGDLHAIERIDMRKFSNIEDYVGLDSALSFLGTRRTAAITIEENSDGTAVIGGLTLGQSGWILRAAGGIYELTEAFGTETTAIVHTAATALEPGTSTPLVTEWYLENPRTTFTGLWHLEGRTVSALGDGDVFEGLVVENGQVVLPAEVSRVHIGLPYTARIETLPLYSAQVDANGKSATSGRRHRPIAVKVRMENTRGLQYGMLGQDLWDMPSVSTALLGGPLLPSRDNVTRVLSSSWKEDQQVVVEQPNPLPAFVLALLVESEIGD